MKLMSGFSLFENRLSGGIGLGKLLFIPDGFLKVTLFTDTFVTNLFKELATLQNADKKLLLSEIYHKEKKSTSKIMCQGSELSKNFTFLRKL